MSPLLVMNSCDCGAAGASWHGPDNGMRTYCCDACWAAISARDGRVEHEVAWDIYDRQLQEQTHPIVVPRQCSCPSCPCGTGHKACRCPSPYYPRPACRDLVPQ